MSSFYDRFKQRPINTQWGLLAPATRPSSWLLSDTPFYAGSLGLVDNCVFTPASSGLGDFYISAPVLGSMTPSQAGAIVGDRYHYAARSADQTQWEIGIGTYGAGVLYRNSVIWSSNSNALVNFTVIPTVSLDALTEDFGGVRHQRSVTTTPIIIFPSDQILNCNLGVTATCSLPSSSSRNGVLLTFKDVGGQFAKNNITITTYGSEKIDGALSIVLNLNYQAVTLVPFSDGVNNGWAIE